MSWWNRLTDPTPDPVLDRGAAQRRMVADAPPVVAAPSPFADLAAAHIRIAVLEEDLAAEQNERMGSDAAATAIEAECDVLRQALADECTAHGVTMGNLRRESARADALDVVHVETLRQPDVAMQQRDAARVAETMCSVSRCPRCQTDVGCLPVGWWCDECTRAYPVAAHAHAVRTVMDRIVSLTGDVPPWVKTIDAWLRAVAEERLPCAKCTDRVHTLSARDWCDWCESSAVQDGDADDVVHAVIHAADCPGGPTCPCDLDYLTDALRAASWEHPRSECWTRVARLAVEIVRDLRIGQVVEPADDELTRREAVLAGYDQRKRDDELIEKARVLGDEVGQRIVTSAEARDLPNGTVLLNVKSSGKHVIHAVVRDGHGWWSCEDRLSGPIGGDQRYAVLYVPGTAETREVRPVAGRDRAAAIEGAAITLRAHARQVSGPGRISCMCGWGGAVPWRTLTEHAHHQAEQLAAVGALGNHAATPPDLIDKDGDRWSWRAGYLHGSPPVGVRSRELVDASFGPVTEATEPAEVPF